MQIIKFIYCLFLIGTITACGQTNDFNTYINTYYNFSVDTLHPAHLEQMDSTIKIIDARSSSEFSVSKIKGAQYLNYESPDWETLSIDSLDTIVVYCTIGYRSEKIGEKLKEKGYKNVYNLYGGILGWVNDGNKVYTPTGIVTQYVHTYDDSWGKWLTNQDCKGVTK